MSYCEPCQSLTAAALSRRWRVPQGNFEGATYVVSASVTTIEDGAQFLKVTRGKMPRLYYKKVRTRGLFYSSDIEFLTKSAFGLCSIT